MEHDRHDDYEGGRLAAAGRHRAHRGPGHVVFPAIGLRPPAGRRDRGGEGLFPVSAVGELAHVVPQEGLREVSREDADGSGHGSRKSSTTIPALVESRATGSPPGISRPRQGPNPYTLDIRSKTVTVEKELLVGQPVYSSDVEFYGNEQPVIRPQIDMKPVKLFGVVPGIDWLLMPPWLVAYFLIAIPSVSLIKR